MVVFKLKPVGVGLKALNVTGADAGAYFASVRVRLG